MNTYDQEPTDFASTDTNDSSTGILGNFDQKEVVNFFSGNQGVLYGFLAGAAIGAAAALLFAPSSGQRLRSQIVDKAGSLKDQVVEKAGEWTGTGQTSSADYSAGDVGTYYNR